MKKIISFILILFCAQIAEGAVITRTIGTSGRNYSTITLWEADLDNVAVYASGDSAVGEIYNDSVFDEAPLSINGGGTVGLTKVTLTVAPGQRHTGVAGTGARMVASVARAGFYSLVPLAGTQALVFEWLELNANGKIFTGPLITTAAATFGRVPVIQRIIGHDLVTGTANLHMIGGSGRDMVAQDNIIYDMSASGGNSRMAKGIFYDAQNVAGGIFNNTVYKMIASGAGTSQDAIGIDVVFDDTDKKVRNNIAMNMSAGSISTAAGFRFQVGTSNGTVTNNMSDDATADDQGTSHLINKSIATQFVSTVDGSEDFHLVSGSDAINAGVDLVNTPTGVKFDIDGYDRDATGVVWDIGADEFTGYLRAARTIRLHGVRLHGVRLQ
ncbi:MAG TPA: choice-of-anchor Q domain-containing protein [Candidatus Paceibacterota bacterium]